MPELWLCTDNAALMGSQPEYLRSLEKLPPKLREAWLHGRWDVYEGQFFEDFSDVNAVLFDFVKGNVTFGPVLGQGVKSVISATHMGMASKPSRGAG